jgi:hypothetical protein
VGVEGAYGKSPNPSLTVGPLRYRRAMTSTSAVEVSAAAEPLLPGASPATIRSFLLPGDQPRFVEAYEAALDEARRTLELEPVDYVVEQWRRVALLQADPERFHRARPRRVFLISLIIAP